MVSDGEVYILFNGDRGGWKYLTGCGVVLKIMFPVIQIHTSHGILNQRLYEELAGEIATYLSSTEEKNAIYKNVKIHLQKNP